jgi:peptidyl-prolyl cis-trans isomerase A (cyclophilin A)
MIANLRVSSVLLAVLLLMAPGCSRERAEEPAREPAETSVEESTGPEPTEGPGALYDPARADLKAPGVFDVRFETTKGDVLLRVHRNWAPMGADRFYNLVKIGYFDDTAFFRVLPGFMAQFGISGDPEVNRIWRKSEIPDDSVRESNRRGYLSFATAGPNTRTTQVFINYGDNSQLDGMGFAPIGRVVDGMNVVDSLFSGYGEGSPQGKGPNQGYIQARGNDYLRQFFPNLDYIKKATVTKE